MTKASKTFLFSLSGIAGIGLLLLVIKLSVDHPYKKQLPEPPETSNLPAPLQKQISAAALKARLNPASINLGYLGMVYHSSGFYDKASQCYKLATKRDSSQWMWSYYMGYLSKELGENDAVVKYFGDVVRTTPENNLAWFYIGEGYQALGLNDKADSIFGKIIARGNDAVVSSGSSRKDLFPLNAYARFQLANIYLVTQRLADAERSLQETVQDQPSFGQAYRLLASIYSSKGDQETARKYMTRAGDLRIYTPPVDTMADILSRISLSDLYLLKQVDDAEKGGYNNFSLELISNALENIPDNKFIISKAIKIYLSRGFDKLAIPYIDRHIQYFSEEISEIRMVADLCMQRGLYAEATKYYEQALKILPDDVDLKLAMILCLGHEGKKQQAIDDMNRLIEKNGESLKILSNGVYIMDLIGEKERAVAYLSRLKDLFPADPKVLQLSGLELDQSGESDKALPLYEASYKRNPRDFTTARYLGELLMRQQMWGRAIDHYRNAIEYFPNEPYIQEKLGTLLVMCPDLKLRNYKEGMEYSERAFTNKASPAMTVVTAGRCLYESYAATGDKQNAYKYLIITANLARHEKAPSEILESLDKELQNFK